MAVGPARRERFDADVRKGIGRYRGVYDDRRALEPRRHWMMADEVHALVVPPNDPGALAEAVARVLRDTALAERLAAAGLARQRSRASADLMAARIERALCTFDATPGAA